MPSPNPGGQIRVRIVVRAPARLLHRAGRKRALSIGRIKAPLTEQPFSARPPLPADSRVPPQVGVRRAGVRLLDRLLPALRSVRGAGPQPRRRSRRELPVALPRSGSRRRGLKPRRRGNVRSRGVASRRAGTRSRSRREYRLCQCLRGEGSVTSGRRTDRRCSRWW